MVNFVFWIKPCVFLMFSPAIKKDGFIYAFLFKLFGYVPDGFLLIFCVDRIAKFDARWSVLLVWVSALIFRFAMKKLSQKSNTKKLSIACFCMLVIDLRYEFLYFSSTETDQESSQRIFNYITITNIEPISNILSYWLKYLVNFDSACCIDHYWLLPYLNLK